ncbi:sensor histidine kinase [Pseudorhizobium pelagicum]|uniref:histidine kinase n=1 Tax=Pseudorhizobium pelagicum TaxID=1509405 RepID=A0A922P177_9HYPH|nr:HAMP domain-containing sensor histidine kinase [Pseudorhizobium pelagicum]KEQ05263.1 ATPase [Pseudorhizobium pelagicum]KEQ07892.1 ATPase [Pseudorhizobium pelagicum]
MRVLSNIAGKAVGEVDRAADRWLECLGQPEEARGRNVVLLRRVTLNAGVAALLLPAVLTTLLPVSIALPVGATVAVSSFLIAAAATFGRGGRSTPPVASAAADDLVFSACPGLALMLDPHGLVMKCGGRDRTEFPAALHDPCGQRLAELVHVSDRISLMHALDTLRQGQDAASVMVRVQRVYSAEGRQFLHACLEMTAVRRDDGELTAVFAQMRDVSGEEALRDEAALRVTEARSAHEAKTRFLAAVSHELRTPLNAILGFSDVLAGEYFGRLETDRQKEYVGLIRQSGAHLLAVVNTMLDMSKIEAGRYELLAEPFMIGDVIESCRAMLDLQARGRGVTLTARTAKGLGEVTADRRAVKQILINLAGNAIKFTENGGVVSIDAGLVGSDVVLTVSDTGIGIPENKLALIGQPFMQVQDDYTRQYEGTGLGLSLVKGLVALHGGRFHIESRAGEGTVVTVTLPADGAGIEEAALEPADPMVEFPPRLVKPLHGESADGAQKDEQDTENDAAKAKIA